MLAIIDAMMAGEAAGDSAGGGDSGWAKGKGSGWRFKAGTRLRSLRYMLSGSPESNCKPTSSWQQSRDGQFNSMLSVSYSGMCGARQVRGSNGGRATELKVRERWFPGRRDGERLGPFVYVRVGDREICLGERPSRGRWLGELGEFVELESIRVAYQKWREADHG